MTPDQTKSVTGYFDLGQNTMHPGSKPALSRMMGSQIVIIDLMLNVDAVRRKSQLAQSGGCAP